MLMLQRILFIAFLIVASVLVAAPAPETRTHYVIAKRDRTPVYYATAISTSSETQASETYLFEDTSGQRIYIDVRKNYKSHLVTAEYCINDGKPVNVTLHLPGKGTTRSETLKEYRERPELQNEEITLSVESQGQVLKTGEKEWKSGKSAIRDKANAIATQEFINTMKPMSPFLGFPPFGGACSTYPFVSDGGSCSLSTTLMIAAVKPDCAFDAKFGKPCDDKQLTRAKQQPNNGRVGSY